MRKGENAEKTIGEAIKDDNAKPMSISQARNFDSSSNMMNYSYTCMLYMCVDNDSVLQHGLEADPGSRFDGSLWTSRLDLVMV